MIHKTQLNVIETKLRDLGIDATEDTWQDIIIVLSKVSVYMPFYDENGDINNSYCTLYLCSDGCFHINTPYLEFSKLMTEYLQGK